MEESIKKADALSECDIVMKGGITSGVVYPAAVVALSDKYRFRNIGGTSAGAIAAAVTAAAEYGRQANRGTQFGGLRSLPSWLASDGHLLGLFEPNIQTRSLFAFFMGMLASPKGENKLWALVKALFRANQALMLVSAVPGIGAMLGGVLLGWSWLALLGGILLVLLVLGVPAWHLYSCLMTAVPRNFFGICTGLSDRDPNDPAVLTSWLSELINQVAGADHPLTFGDLWSVSGGDLLKAAPDSDIERERDAEREARDINLEMITTNLAHGRPYRFPFETNLFYFDPTDFARLFPPDVVRWMVDHARRAQTDRERQHMAAALPSLPLPESADLPIVVAARMSLSFPPLISAVPLRAVDWAQKQDDTKPTYGTCWFSDGGLSSNFPIHLFDGPIPGRPTFGLDLDSFTDAHPEDDTVQANNVWMPKTNGDGLAETWTTINEGNLGEFFAAILNAMQNWQDNMQSRVPGFRDRIVHVYLSASEGGLNLNMPAQVLNTLAERGKLAGELIIAHFTDPGPATCPNPQPTNWANHRLVRYRTAMSLLETWVRRFCQTYTSGHYQPLVTRSQSTPPCSYRWKNAGQQAYASMATTELIQLNQRLVATGQTFADGAPRPEPELVTRPRV